MAWPHLRRFGARFFIIVRRSSTHCTCLPAQTSHHSRPAAAWPVARAAARALLPHGTVVFNSKSSIPIYRQSGLRRAATRTRPRTCRRGSKTPEPKFGVKLSMRSRLQADTGFSGNQVMTIARNIFQPNTSGMAGFLANVDGLLLPGRSQAHSWRWPIRPSMSSDFGEDRATNHAFGSHFSGRPPPSDRRAVQRQSSPSASF